MEKRQKKISRDSEWKSSCPKNGRLNDSFKNKKKRDAKKRDSKIRD